MSEYWKSTPSYWCKFCSTYVRDTGLERKNHEASGKHQNNIQRSLRDLHRNQEREIRDQQRAKDEVSRLNNLVGNTTTGSKPGIATKNASNKTPQVAAIVQNNLTTAQQRKAHAEQLASLGVELPEELKKEITGVGNFQTVSQRDIEASSGPGAVVERSLADILAESKKQSTEEYDSEDGADQKLALPEYESDRKVSAGMKRKLDDEAAKRDEEAPPNRRNWGSNFKTYPGANRAQNDDNENLDALLSGVLPKREPNLKSEDTQEEKPNVTASADDASTTGVQNSATTSNVKKEEPSPLASQSVIFKKRKTKRPV